jgi:PAS domain S-box-containing protein
MNVDQFHIISAIFVIVAAVFGVALSVFTWQRRHLSDVRYFLWFVITMTIWELAAVFSFISPSPEVAAFWVGKVKFFGVAFLPVACLAFALSYTGRLKLIKSRNLVLFSVIPTITQIMAWTNSPFFITDRIFQRYGPFLFDVGHGRQVWFWIHTAYSYSLIAVSLILLILFAIRSRYPYRDQAMIIMAGSLFSLVANALDMFNLIEPDPPEFTVMVFSGATLLFAWALFRYNLLDIMPVARDTVVEGMVDAVIVTDVYNRIIDMNPAAHDLSESYPDSLIGKNLIEMWPEQKELIESFAGVKDAQTEIIIGQGAASRYFDLNISNLYRRKDYEAGRLVVLRDITERKRFEMQLKAMNLELEKQTEARLKIERKLNEQLTIENLRLGAELDVTRRLQKMLLPAPEELSDIEWLDIAGYMDPTDEVGGDYYDVLFDKGRLKIGIGDVTGHGLESGVLMLMTQSSVRTLLNAGVTDPTQFMNILNHTIYKNAQRMRSDRTLTLSLLDYVPPMDGKSTGILKVSGFHEDVIVVRTNGQVELIDTVELGAPVGLMDDISDLVQFTDISLASGDVVVLYTDGITEAENDAGILYGLDQLCDVIKQNAEKPASEIVVAVVGALHSHIQDHPVLDDITLVVMKQR